jgi:hypothetical protein
MKEVLTSENERNGKICFIASSQHNTSFLMGLMENKKGASKPLFYLETIPCL